MRSPVVWSLNPLPTTDLRHGKGNRGVPPIYFTIIALGSFENVSAARGDQVFGGERREELHRLFDGLGSAWGREMLDFSLSPAAKTDLSGSHLV